MFLYLLAIIYIGTIILILIPGRMKEEIITIEL